MQTLTIVPRNSVSTSKQRPRGPSLFTIEMIDAFAKLGEGEAVKVEDDSATTRALRQRAYRSARMADVRIRVCIGTDGIVYAIWKG